MTCEEAVAAYFTTLKEGFHCVSRHNGRLCVVTPYLYPDHDNIEIFIRPKGDRVVVSDLGETLRYLDTNGMDVMSTPNQLYAARRIADGFGVRVHEGVLVKDGLFGDVGKLVFDVISTVKAIASLLYGNRSYEPRVFDDEVAEFLDSHNLLITRGVKITGESGTQYKVSMRVETSPRRFLIQTLAPRKAEGVRPKVNATLRMWTDINGEFTDSGKKISLLNDEGILFPQAEIAVLEKVSRVYRWTNPGTLPADLQNRDQTSP